ncbi:hypothetical protein AZI87_15480 [Bdellovibrio bacteriovorus]|uniref:Uncharacterized protein n=1 Tax=Bdellovibrio bacteriovorus TaxID=959 RepID=A0A150WKV6_BDEBC|nr:hypothetical protein [Bdellovibrio bacteriovorus]KYG62687.1 hypothetical protein AZI87_15480 [Bdellovibrio bacteriovorus]KYG64536.1 hypothetical protein AZI85_03745 [Bdellovibrio bacteriovorus]
MKSWFLFTLLLLPSLSWAAKIQCQAGKYRLHLEQKNEDVVLTFFDAQGKVAIKGIVEVTAQDQGLHALHAPSNLEITIDDLREKTMTGILNLNDPDARELSKIDMTCVRKK